MSQHPDQQYFDALRKGDQRLIREIYSKFSRSILHWVLQNNGEAEDAQDLFQDALMAIYDRYANRSDFQLTSSFGALLMTICRRKWYDRLAQKKRDATVRNAETARYEEETPEWEAAAEILLHQQRQECLSKVFTLLSDQCQKLLTMITAGELSVESIAATLGLANANAVYQSKHRCTARWRQLFYDHFKEENYG